MIIRASILTIILDPVQSCVVLKTTQNNEPEAVTVTITKDDSGCKKASDSSILLPVLPLLAFVVVSLLSF